MYWFVLCIYRYIHAILPTHATALIDCWTWLLGNILHAVHKRGDCLFYGLTILSLFKNYMVHTVTYQWIPCAYQYVQFNTSNWGTHQYIQVHTSQTGTLAYLVEKGSMWTLSCGSLIVQWKLNGRYVIGNQRSLVRNLAFSNSMYHDILGQTQYRPVHACTGMYHLVQAVMILRIIWNPNEVYSRYIPCIFHVYVLLLNMPGIYHVYTMDIKIPFSCVYA